MNIPNNIRPFWKRFERTTDYDASVRFYEAFHFDDGDGLANELAQLVLDGTKRATAGLLWEYEASGKPLPRSGSLSVVTNTKSEPLCVIESTSVDIVPFMDVSEEFAATEGEGDKSLRFWRDVHWTYFSRECQRLGKQPDERMPVVCEVFRMIYSEVSTSQSPN